MTILKRYIKLSDSVSKATGYFFASFTILLVIIVCYDVLTRYFFRISSVGIQELEWHLFALIFLGAAAYTLMLDEHVRVDVFYTKYSKRTRAWINLFGCLFFLIPFCIIIIYSSYEFVKVSFAILERSPDTGGLPYRYLLKALIPFSFILILLQGISVLFKSLIEIISSKKTEESFSDQSKKETVL